MSFTRKSTWYLDYFLSNVNISLSFNNASWAIMGTTQFPSVWRRDLSESDWSCASQSAKGTLLIGFQASGPSTSGGATPATFGMLKFASFRLWILQQRTVKPGSKKHLKLDTRQSETTICKLWASDVAHKNTRFLPAWQTTRLNNEPETKKLNIGILLDHGTMCYGISCALVWKKQNYKLDQNCQAKQKKVTYSKSLRKTPVDRSCAKSWSPRTASNAAFCTPEVTTGLRTCPETSYNWPHETRQLLSLTR